MSLTSFLKNRDVKERFRQEFETPRFETEKDLLAPPLSNRYSLVGTAFDYLMRFYLKHLNADAVTTHWVAELVLTNPLSALLEDVVVDGQTGQILSFRETALTRKAAWIIEQAKADYSRYLIKSRITDQLIESAIRLAQLDPIFRAGVVDESLGDVHSEDVADLRTLISIVEPRLFRAARLCLLNPTFAEGSRLVGGADADLVLDDMIIDIKTTKNLRLARNHFDQLMGYFTLHDIGGVGDITPKPQISRVAIYFSRHAFLYTLDLRDIIRPERFPAFVRWFTTRAMVEFPA